MNRKGITLVALIVTIIVLLILAGITINLTIGQDGILKRAEEAGKNYTEAAEKEKTELVQFSNLTDKIIDNVTKNHYTMVEGVPVPKGFSYLEGTKDTGFVIKNDTDGNEFVWVPCTIDGAKGTIKYDRYAFTKEGWTYNQTLDATTGEIIQGTEVCIYTQTMPSDEQRSIERYGGFYIGRYETGIEGYTSVNDTTSNTQNVYTGYTGGKAVIKQNQQIWNYITTDKAKIVSEALYKKSNGASVNSKLCSGYAWDTALKFIDTKNPGYSTNSTVGNYLDKSDELGKPAKTGLTEAVNNIYDMGGNAWELTTEETNKEGNPYTGRGGNYRNGSGSNPAAIRSYRSKTNIFDDVSFRITIYL